MANIASQVGRSRTHVNQRISPPIHVTFPPGSNPELVLDILKFWPINNNFQVQDCLSYLEAAWFGPFAVQTGGVRGNRFVRINSQNRPENERLLLALAENKPFWDNCWEETRKGGLFKFLTSPFSAPTPRAHDTVDEQMTETAG